MRLGWLARAAFAFLGSQDAPRGAIVLAAKYFFPAFPAQLFPIVIPEFFGEIVIGVRSSAMEST